MTQTKTGTTTAFTIITAPTTGGKAPTTRGTGGTDTEARSRAPEIEPESIYVVM